MRSGSILGNEDADEFIAYYGVTPAGNFEGMNILNVVGDDPAGPTSTGMKTALLEVRGSRVRPGLDDKVLAAWNGLAIRAFAEAGAVLEDEHLLELARSVRRFRHGQPGRRRDADEIVA